LESTARLIGHWAENSPQYEQARKGTVQHHGRYNPHSGAEGGASEEKVVRQLFHPRSGKKKRTFLGGPEDRRNEKNRNGTGEKTHSKRNATAAKGKTGLDRQLTGNADAEIRNNGCREPPAEGQPTVKCRILPLIDPGYRVPSQPLLFRRGKRTSEPEG